LKAKLTVLQLIEEQIDATMRPQKTNVKARTNQEVPELPPVLLSAW
jgi:hypothetical protein